VVSALAAEIESTLPRLLIYVRQIKSIRWVRCCLRTQSHDDAQIVPSGNVLLLVAIVSP
jgi:hypothetical protein